MGIKFYTMIDDKRRSKTLRINPNEVLRIDEGMALAVSILNEHGIKTLGCCSGHYRYRPTIIVERYGKIIELISGNEIPRKERFYIKDKKGFYYVPEVDEEK